jgi:hypothetical protein
MTEWMIDHAVRRQSSTGQAPHERMWKIGLAIRRQCSTHRLWVQRVAWFQAALCSTATREAARQTLLTAPRLATAASGVRKYAAALRQARVASECNEPCESARRQAGHVEAQQTPGSAPRTPTR